jgi:hypothetical protein
VTSEASSSVLNAGFVHFISGLLIDGVLLAGNHSRSPKLASVIELRRPTTTISGRRRGPWLKGIGWLAVAALSVFIVLVAAGVVQDKIHRPHIYPGKPPEPERLRNGWGEPETFVGQYKVRFLKGEGANRSTGYAEYAGERFQEGHLTMFMREVYEHKPLVPGGVLVLQGPVHNLVLYLSELSSNGGRVLYATIKGGTYEGPAIGSFGGVRRGNRIYGGLRLRGLANVEANFIRYSKNPNPPTSQVLPEE